MNWYTSKEFPKNSSDIFFTFYTTSSLASAYFSIRVWNVFFIENFPKKIPKTVWKILDIMRVLIFSISVEMWAILARVQSDAVSRHCSDDHICGRDDWYDSENVQTTQSKTLLVIDQIVATVDPRLSTALEYCHSFKVFFFDKSCPLFSAES